MQNQKSATDKSQNIASKLFRSATLPKKGEVRGSGWSPELNLADGTFAFQANTEYIVGSKYVTDSKCPRVTRVSGVLKDVMADRNKQVQKNVGKLVRESGDQGGHLIASRFGGSGQGINLVPMATVINQKGGKWFNMEESFAKLVKSGETVSVDIQVFYENDVTLRPSSFQVVAAIGSGKTLRYDIENPL